MEINIPEILSEDVIVLDPSVISALQMNLNAGFFQSVMIDLLSALICF